MKSLPFFLSVFLLLAFSFPPADVKLEYEFKVGDEYIWSQSTKQTVKQSIMGMEQSLTNDISGEYQLKVIQNTASGAKIEIQYTKLRNASKSPMGESVMDSNGAAESTENKLMKSLVNKPFFIYMNKRGEVEKLEGTENLTSGLKETGMDEKELQMTRSILQQFLNESSLKASIEQIFVVYPDKKVKQGDSWKVKNHPGMNFPMVLENTWNIEAISAVNANLIADGIFTTTDKNLTFDLPGGFKAKSDLAGKQAIKSSVNIKTGWPTKLEVLAELKGNMTLLAGGMIPEDMEVPMEILSETTNTILKK
jgi:hypothetical protein